MWVPSTQDSNTAPQTSQDTWPVCGIKNFASVRLYSAPQLHLTIVAILRICAYGTPKQVESRFHTVSASCRTGGEAFGEQAGGHQNPNRHDAGRRRPRRT